MSRWLWAGLLLALAGCAATPRQATEAPPPVDNAPTEPWSTRGRLAVAVAGEGGSGAFTWRQDVGRSELAVRGPLGVGAFNVTLAGDEFTVTEADGVTLTGEAARQQVQSRLGTELPLESLRYWMVGLPAPSPPAEVQDSPVPPMRTIEQGGWQIVYDGFARSGALTAPTRLTATGGNVRLRLIFDAWETGGSSVPVP